jgi:hypothetical protein
MFNSENLQSGRGHAPALYHWLQRYRLKTEERGQTPFLTAAISAGYCTFFSGQMSTPISSE